MAFLRRLAVAGLLGALAVPFFLVEVPPVLDYPNHLARLYVLASAGNDPVLSAMYAPHWAIIPNLALDLVGPPLMRFLPVHVAGRILLAGAALAPVLGVLAYHRAVFAGRSWWPLASSLVAFNGIFFLGFINFLYGIGLALAGAAAWIRWSDRHPLVATAGAMLIAVALFFTHVFGVLYFALLIAAHEIAGVWRRRLAGASVLQHGVARAALLVAALLPAAFLYAGSTLAGVAEGVVWETPARKLIDLLSPFMTYHQPMTALTFAGVAAAVILLWRLAQRDAGTFIAAIVLLAVYAVAPSTMKGGTFIDVRLPLMIVLLIFAGLRPVVAGRSLAVGLVAAGAVLLVARTGSIATAWFNERSDLAALRTVLAPLDPGARVLVVTASPVATPQRIASEPAARRVPGLYRMDLHMPALMLIERRAFWPFLFADPHQQPVRVRAPYAEIGRSLAEPPDFRLLAAEDRLPAAAEYLDDWPSRFDHVLLLDARATDTAAFLPNRLAVLAESDFAALYEVRKR